MKTLTLLSGIFALSLAKPSFSHDLTLLISAYQHSQGNSYISLHNNAASFDGSGGQALAAVKQQLSGNGLKLTFHNLPSGDYAVRIFHDENDNRELDRNIIGIPTEPYGFSNNAGAFGPASFEDAKISLSGDQIVTIELR
ncbi:MAG: DUF2141 domain-containing protein [Cellvibrionaceae bacterium]|nr:DUF2141 domain-containing protein [Cellvibrionaceae bacterium]